MLRQAHQQTTVVAECEAREPDGVGRRPRHRAVDGGRRGSAADTADGIDTRDGIDKYVRHLTDEGATGGVGAGRCDARIRRSVVAFVIGGIGGSAAAGVRLRTTRDA